VAEQVGAAIYEDREEKDPVKIATAALKKAKQDQHDVVIIDTAGRLAIDEVLMDEIKGHTQCGIPIRNTLCSGLYDGSGCGQYGQSL
jgi:signal recognition particle GTPase